jgi:hypothetical protein
MKSVSSNSPTVSNASIESRQPELMRKSQATVPSLEAQRTWRLRGHASRMNGNSRSSRSSWTRGPVAATFPPLSPGTCAATRCATMPPDGMLS